MTHSSTAGILALIALLVLPACQTIEEAARADVLAVCAGGGYGPSSPHHSYCVSNLMPMAVQLERDRRLTAFSNGVARSSALIARGLNPQPQVTCVRDGNVTRCY
jgi:hypothetical protein